MTFEKGVFYFFAALVIFAAFRVISVRNPVHAVLHLVLAFFASAALWLLLEAEFLAITLVLVYVGAVMVLFLFVVMMLDINVAPLREGFIKYLPIGILIGGVIVFEMVIVLTGGFENTTEVVRHGADYSNTKELGSLLYTVYLYPFEIAAVILLLAIVAAISLTMRRRPGLKHQDVGKQVAVRRQDRIRLVKMAAERSADTGEPGLEVTTQAETETKATSRALELESR
jgi:NADH-quinone oxidoreductase subunit J